MTKETLHYSDYVIYEKKNSQIDIGKALNIEVGFKCPSCKEEIKPLEHGEKIACTNCKLYIQRLGNSLECEKTE